MSNGPAFAKLWAHLGFRHVVALSVRLAICGCVPTRTTIGGYDEEELKKWAVQAGELCRLRTGQEPPNSFTRDGCTLSPDGTWPSCCGIGSWDALKDGLAR